jgi:ATP synthase protein I
MWRSALKYSALGLEMGVAVAIGYGLGWWLDRRFGTKPYLMLVMLLLGIAAGFRGLIRAAQEAARESQAEDDRAKHEAKDDPAKLDETDDDAKR